MTPPLIPFHELQVGTEYAMTTDGGPRFSEGDPALILWKIPGTRVTGSVIEARNVRTGMIFTVQGASWFGPKEEV